MSRSRPSLERPSPGLTSRTPATPMSTASVEKSRVKTRVLKPIRPTLPASPISAVPRMSAETTRGITAMKMRRMKICPTGWATRTAAHSTAWGSRKARASRPRQAPRASPMNILQCMGSFMAGHCIKKG